MNFCPILLLTQLHPSGGNKVKKTDRTHQSVNKNYQVFSEIGYKDTLNIMDYEASNSLK